MARYCIDYGHCTSGADTGAVGCGHKEQDCTRDIGRRVTTKLRSLGHTVTETCVDNASSVNDSLGRRKTVINNSGCDLSISLHLNAGGGRGVEIFVDGHSNSTAQSIINQLISLGYVNRGLKTGDLAVVNYVNPSAMLIECGFIDSQEDMGRYNPESIANAIVKGIDSRFNSTSSQPQASSLKFALDEPSDTKIKDSDTLKIRGWSLNHKKLEVYIDNMNYGTIETGVKREDVYKVYPQYNNHYAGYEKIINFNGITNGGHKCTIKATDNNGAVKEVSKWFNIEKPLRIALDEPNGKTFKEGDINVSGWALTGFHKGIESIEVFINNKSYGQAIKGQTRNDVAKVYPWYYNALKCGYSLSIPVLNLDNGEYTVKVVIKADKETLETTRKFKINKPDHCDDCLENKKKVTELKEKLKKINELSK